MKHTRKPKQVARGLLWQGPSLLDGQPIVAVGVYRTGKGVNSKTGAMVQTYIIRADVDPVAAIQSGADVSVCGDCKLRGNGGQGRGCYVNLGQGPLAVYKAFTRGNYPAIDPAELGRGRMVRLGTYGDPAAVPVAVWDSLLEQAKGHTGYTHQWRIRPDLARITMASADTPADASAAWRLGFRTFRLSSEPTNVEIQCPSDLGISCLDCGLCDGTRNGTRAAVKSITIPPHGTGRRWAAAVANGAQP